MRDMQVLIGKGYVHFDRIGAYADDNSGIIHRTKPFVRAMGNTEQTRLDTGVGMAKRWNRCKTT